MVMAVHAAATKTYNRLGQSFGPGRLFPYDVLVVPPPGQDALSLDTFNFTYSLVFEHLVWAKSNACMLPGSAVACMLVSYLRVLGTLKPRGDLYRHGLATPQQAHQRAAFQSNYAVH